MHDFIFEILLSTRYISVFLLGFAFPTESVMLPAGYLAAKGILFLPAALAIGTVGTTLWAMMIYAIARLSGKQAAYRLVDRYGLWFGVRRRNVDRAGKWFDRHARVAIFVGRFIPGIRTAVSIPAGLRGMPLGQFILFTMLGSAIDAALLGWMGYVAGVHFEELRQIVDNVSMLIVCGLLLIGISWILWRRRG